MAGVLHIDWTKRSIIRALASSRLRLQPGSSVTAVNFIPLLEKRGLRKIVYFVCQGRAKNTSGGKRSTSCSAHDTHIRVAWSEKEKWTGAS